MSSSSLRVLFFILCLNCVKTISDSCRVMKYTVGNEKLIWPEAVKWCERDGKMLASIKSQQEQNDMETVLRQKGIISGWIGLRYVDADQSWQWIDDNSSLSSNNYSNWKPTEPNRLKYYSTYYSYMEGCVITTAEERRDWSPSKKYQWNDLPCLDANTAIIKHEVYQYPICEYNDCKNITETTELCFHRNETCRPNSHCEGQNALPICNCEQGHKFSEDVCCQKALRKKKFTFGNEKLTWNQAVELCDRDGKRLASIKSQQEQDNIGILLKSKGIDSAWIGLHYVDDESWRWVGDNSPLNSSNYSNFAPNEPNRYRFNSQGSKEGCVVTMADGNGGHWNDLLCSDEKSTDKKHYVYTYPLCEYYECKNIIDFEHK